MPVPAVTQLAIFDFDGTLANSLGDVLDTYNSVARQMGIATVSTEQLPHLRKLAPREVARELEVPFWRVPQIVTAVRRAMRARMAELEPFDGISEMLHSLWSRGVKTAIVSSNAEENVNAFLARHAIDRFDLVSCGVSLFGKAARLRQVARRRQFAGLDPVYVGDESRDVEAAVAAGMRSVAVSWGYGEPSVLAAQGPDHLVNAPGELLSLLAPG